MLRSSVMTALIRVRPHPVHYSPHPLPLLLLQLLNRLCKMGMTTQPTASGTPAQASDGPPARSAKPSAPGEEPMTSESENDEDDEEGIPYNEDKSVGEGERQKSANKRSNNAASLPLTEYILNVVSNISAVFL